MRAFTYSRTMLILRAFSFPVVVIAAVFFQAHPREIFDIYSNQGAFTWLLVHFCWPWLACVAFTCVFRHRAEGTKTNLLFAFGIVSVYALLTLLVSMYASQHLNTPWGDPQMASTFWRALNSPMSLLLFFIK